MKLVHFPPLLLFLPRALSSTCCGDPQKSNFKVIKALSTKAHHQTPLFHHQGAEEDQLTSVLLLMHHDNNTRTFFFT